MATDIIKGNATLLTLTLTRGVDVNGDPKPFDMVAEGVMDTTVHIKRKGSEASVPDKEFLGIPGSAKILINTPNVGDVGLDLDSNDTSLTPGLFNLAIEAEIDANTKIEFPREELNIIDGLIS